MKGNNMTTKDEIRDWLKIGVRDNHKYMIVYCDTFDYTDYPVYAKDSEAFHYIRKNGYMESKMQKLVEVYDLSLDIEEQLNEERAYHPPK